MPCTQSVHLPRDGVVPGLPIFLTASYEPSTGRTMADIDTAVATAFASGDTANAGHKPPERGADLEELGIRDGDQQGDERERCPRSAAIRSSGRGACRPRRRGLSSQVRWHSRRATAKGRVRRCCPGSHRLFGASHVGVIFVCAVRRALSAFRRIESALPVDKSCDLANSISVRTANACTQSVQIACLAGSSAPPGISTFRRRSSAPTRHRTRRNLT